MALELAGHRATGELTGDAFGVKRVIFSDGAMSGTEQRLLRKRLGSELDAVRELIRKVEFFPVVGPSGEAGAASPGEALMEFDWSSEAKRTKVSPLAQRTEEQKRAMPDERELLAGRLALLAAALPDHVVAFLQNQTAGAGDADDHGEGSEIEMGMQSVKDGALFLLKLLLDKFAPASTPKNHGRAALNASGVSFLSQHHQGVSGETGPVEKEGDVGICGGASRRIELRDIAEEYGELVGAIGVMLLSPLPHKYVDLAEDDEYVDICGDASPVVFPATKTIEIGSSPSSSNSGSGASSSDSDTSPSDFNSGSDSDKNVGCSPPPLDFHKENNSEQAAQPSKPTLQKVQIAEPMEIQHQRALPVPTMRPISSSPHAPLVLPKESDITTQLLEAAPKEAVQSGKAQELQNQCVVPAPMACHIVKSPQAPWHPQKNHTSAQPPAAVHSVESEELQNQHAKVTTLTEPPIDKSPPALVAPLPNENGVSAQPLPPVHPMIVELEAPQVPSVAADDPLTNLIAKAQEAIERRRQEDRNRARQNARQELLEVERAALPDERIHPLDMELLGIAAFEHIVSTVEAARTVQPRENGRVASGCPTVMQFLGLFLKAGDVNEEQEQQLGVDLPGGADMDMEEGEIR